MHGCCTAGSVSPATADSKTRRSHTLCISHLNPQSLFQSMLTWDASLTSHWTTSTCPEADFDPGELSPYGRQVGFWFLFLYTRSSCLWHFHFVTFKHVCFLLILPQSRVRFETRCGECWQVSPEDQFSIFNLFGWFLNSDVFRSRDNNIPEVVPSS